MPYITQTEIISMSKISYKRNIEAEEMLHKSASEIGLVRTEEQGHHVHNFPAHLVVQRLKDIY